MINRMMRVNRKKLTFFMGGVLLISTLGLAGYRIFKPERSGPSDQATYAVTKGPLTISVIAAGTIKSREQYIIKNEVEGRTSIIYLVSEGTIAKKGDLLVELDASRLLDEKIDQEIKVQNAGAAFIGAREELAIMENLSQSEIDKAQVVYDFAKGDLQKYLDGEYPNQVKDLESKITLAREELTRAKEKVDWSRRLFDEKYLSETELAADELTMKRKEMELELAKNNLDLLVNYTHKRTLAQLESDMKQAEMTLDRTRKKARADVIQVKANLEAKEAEFRRQKDKLVKFEALIGKAKIYAPADGLVIHATSTQRSRRVQPLEEGQEVRERQELIYLPSTDAANVEVAIPEASLDKVRPGLPVKVTIDALPGEVFWGRVERIAPLPDARSAWMNPDLKVYNTDITLDNGGGSIRAGMSCKTEIIVEQYKEAVYVPLQALLRVRGEPTVYVLKEGELEPRRVEAGLDNNRMVRIVKGLKAGELVSLTPPLAAAEAVEVSREAEKRTAPTEPDENALGREENGEAKDVKVKGKKGERRRRAKGSSS